MAISRYLAESREFKSINSKEVNKYRTEKGLTIPELSEETCQSSFGLHS